MDAAKIMDSVLARFIGTKHERDIKKLRPTVAQITALEAEIKRLTDDELRTRFAARKAEVAERLKAADPAEPSYKDALQAALDPVIAPSFALAREAGRRFLNMRHFDVQLIGGLVLHDGKISEIGRASCRGRV